MEPQLPRIVTVVLVLAAIIVANNTWPEGVQAILLLVALYLIVTHSGRVSAALSGASASFSGAFAGGSSATPRAGGGGRPPLAL